MMDSLEAIKGLDGYTEILVSLSALLGAKIFDEKRVNTKACSLKLKKSKQTGDGSRLRS
jgi:hypothetical protein